MKCKYCHDEENQIKARQTKVGSQRYKCKICGKYYVPEGKKRGYSEDIKKQAIKLYLEENSSRAVGRILGIGKKHVPVLDSKICKGDRAQRDAECSG